MNSLNALGNRHLASLNADITKLETGQAGPSLQGELHRALHSHLILPWVGSTAILDGVALHKRCAFVPPHLGAFQS
jgi:hypothetical protein